MREYSKATRKYLLPDRLPDSMEQVRQQARGGSTGIILRERRCESKREDTVIRDLPEEQLDRRGGSISNRQIRAQTP